MDYFNNRFLNSFQQPQQSCPFIYVSNLEEAKTYPVVPNNTCILFNHDFSAFYIKKVDSMGIPEISMFKAERVPIETSPIQADAKSVEIDELKKEISELKALICNKQEVKDESKSVSTSSAI